MRILLNEMRRKRAMNQHDLSARSGVPQPMISEIESGVVQNPTIRTLYKLAVALKCTVDDLVVDERQGA